MISMKRYIKPMGVVFFTVMLFMTGSFYLNHLLKKDMIAQQTEQLSGEIDLLTPFLIDKDELVFNPEKLSQSLSGSERITVLSATGHVLYDSSHQVSLDVTRKNRPEIKGILEGEAKELTDIRDSQTVNTELLYVAKGIYVNDELIGVVRLAENYLGVSENIMSIQRSVTLILFILLLFMLILALYIYRQNKKPLDFILPILKEATQNPEKKQEIIEAPSEWRELYETVYELMDETNLLYYKQLQNKEKLYFLFNNLSIGIFILNQDLEITLANTVVEEWFQKKWKVESYETWISHKKLKQMIRLAVEGGEDVQGEIRVKRPKYRNLKVVIRPLQSEKKEYVCMIYDVTEIRQMEKVHEDFISNISHELKTPTTSIIGFAETLLAGAKDDPDASVEFITIIEREGQRLLSLIQHIMMLLKTEKDLHVSDSLRTSPVSIIQEELKRYTHQMKKKQLDVSFDESVDSTILVSSQGFQIIVKNLLENAIEYSEESGKIFIYLTQSEDELIFKIEDTGIGISKEDQLRIFERFYRVSHSRQRNTGGSGLGLSLVQHYADLLGGYVKLSSDLGEGTTVIVRFQLDYLMD
ncbi:sensor histidine kinase [Vagococcus jeotgali]|uniref:sensor histidine kinase n=1 Tax=Vagococcus jeotgali TaxID=3109030 RepID=UPI002DD7D42A|nr:ATP-binding protein [Vagococcus sp. B2T-5]